VPLRGGHGINTESNTLPNPDKHESSKNRHPVNTEIVVGSQSEVDRSIMNTRDFALRI